MANIFPVGNVSANGAPGSGGLWSQDIRISLEGQCDPGGEMVQVSEWAEAEDFSINQDGATGWIEPGKELSGVMKGEFGPGAAGEVGCDVFVVDDDAVVDTLVLSAADVVSRI
ncbi:MAG: hypothetical protein AAF799_41440 [Myxococcota bacterium]